NPGKKPFLCDYVTMTNSTCLNTNPYVSSAGLRDFTLDDFKLRTGLRYLYSFHFWHSGSPKSIQHPFASEVQHCCRFRKRRAYLLCCHCFMENAGTSRAIWSEHK